MLEIIYVMLKEGREYIEKPVDINNGCPYGSITLKGFSKLIREPQLLLFITRYG